MTERSFTVLTACSNVYYEIYISAKQVVCFQFILRRIPYAIFSLNASGKSFFDSAQTHHCVKSADFLFESQT
jgi:hypothetical protein